MLVIVMLSFSMLPLIIMKHPSGSVTVDLLEYGVVLLSRMEVPCSLEL